MARMGLTGRSQLAGRSRRLRRTRLVADGLAAAVVLTGVTVGMVNVAGASGTKPKAIKVSTTTIPKIGTVLTTASGLTLYRFTQDTKGKSNCTGVCAKAWPPLTAAKGEHVEGPKGVKGLSVINVGHGRWQVAFHSVALYRFVGDKKKGQAHGQGLANVWFAALKSGIPAGNAAPATTTTAAGRPAPSIASTPAPAPTSPSSAPTTGGRPRPPRRRRPRRPRRHPPPPPPPAPPPPPPRPLRHRPNHHDDDGRRVRLLSVRGLGVTAGPDLAAAGHHGSARRRRWARALGRPGWPGHAVLAEGIVLVGPAVLLLVLVAVVAEQLWPAERRPLDAAGHRQDLAYLALYAAVAVPAVTLIGTGPRWLCPG